jgi:hypothetical protein
MRSRVLLRETLMLNASIGEMRRGNGAEGG